MDLLALGAALSILSFLLGFLGRPLLIRSRPPAEKRSAKCCDVCGVPLPANALRTHDGHWRCAAHKATKASVWSVPGGVS